MKTCSRCLESKSESEFYRERGGLTAACRSCILRAKREERERFKLRTDDELNQAAIARGHKTCATCKDVKLALTEFPQDRGRPDGRGSHCHECNAEKTRVDRAAKRELYKKRRSARYEEDRDAERRRQLRFKFGITPEQYQAMHDDQRGLCAICGEPETRERGGRLCVLCVDHDHITGVVRQLLCFRCNTGLGYYRDNPALLRRAALYVENHQNIQQRESPPA